MNKMRVFFIKLFNKGCRVRNDFYSFVIRFFFPHCPSNVKFEKNSYICGHKYISIGSLCRFQQGLYLTAWDSYKGKCYSPSILFGSNCSIGAYNHITCINQILIGENFLSGKWVTISDNSHGAFDETELQKSPQNRDIMSKGPVIIGKNVWVGDKSTILSGVKIGDGVIVAANSVVTNDVPSYCMVAGTPARIIKKIEIKL